MCVLERRDLNKHTQASERERFVCGCLYASEGGGVQYTRRNTTRQQRRGVARAAGSMGLGSGETAAGILLC